MITNNELFCADSNDGDKTQHIYLKTLQQTVDSSYSCGFII